MLTTAWGNVGTRGGCGAGWGPCACPGGNAIQWGLRGANRSHPNQDKHKAPSSTPRRPLSLQDPRPQASQWIGFPDSVVNIHQAQAGFRTSTNQGRSGIQSKSWFVTQIAGELYILSLYWHLSVLPTLVLARLGNATASLNLSVSPTRLRRYCCAVRRDARHTVRGQPRRKALRSYPTGQARRKEQGLRQDRRGFPYEKETLWAWC